MKRHAYKYHMKQKCENHMEIISYENHMKQNIWTSCGEFACISKINWGIVNDNGQDLHISKQVTGSIPSIVSDWHKGMCRGEMNNDSGIKLFKPKQLHYSIHFLSKGICGVEDVRFNHSQTLDL